MCLKAIAYCKRNLHAGYNASNAIVKLRLGIVHLRDGVCLLALELRTLIVKLCLSITPQLLDALRIYQRGDLTLEQRFIELAGGLGDAEGLEWLHTFSD